MLIPVLRLVAGAVFGYIVSSTSCEESQNVKEMGAEVQDLQNQISEIKEQNASKANAAYEEANAAMDEVLKQQQQVENSWDDAKKTFMEKCEAMQRRHENFQQYTQDMQEQMEKRAKRIDKIDQDMRALNKEIDDSLSSLEAMIAEEKDPSEEPSKESLKDLKEKLESNNAK